MPKKPSPTKLKQLCLLCGGDATNKRKHALTCPGRHEPPPGPFEPRMAIAPSDEPPPASEPAAPAPDPPLPPLWMPPFDPESSAFAGLDRPTLDAIRGAVPKDMVIALVGYLTDIPRHADEVRRALAGHPWFPAHTKRDTQLRRIRTIRDAAIAWGYPVCSTNAGYALGSWTQVIETAVRARRFASGAYARATVLETLAERLRVA